MHRESRFAPGIRNGSRGLTRREVLIAMNRINAVCRYRSRIMFVGNPARGVCAACVILSFALAYAAEEKPAAETEEKPAVETGEKPAIETGKKAAAETWERWNEALKDLPIGPLKLDIGGELRLRYEDQDAFDVRRYDPAARDRLLLTRAMLDFNLRMDDPKVNLFLQLRDAHAVDSRLKENDFPQNNPIEDHCDIRQAYIQWLRIGGSPFGFKAGRQQINYGDQRVFGPGLWGNTGRYAWNAAMLKAETDLLDVDAWVGRFIENRPDTWPNRAFPDPTAFVAYVSVKKLPVRLDFFYAARYDPSGDTRGEKGVGDLISHSPGFQSEGKFAGHFDYSATFVAQFGEYGKDRIEAFGAAAALGFTAPIPWKPRLAARFAWGSGDGNPGDGVHETFDGVFGGADRFYGDLNLFFWSNLRDYELDLRIEPTGKLLIFAEYHYFTLDRSKDAWYTTGLRPLRRDITGASGARLGWELDLRAVWMPFRGFEIMVGYGIFEPGRFVRSTGKDDAAHGFFLQFRQTF